MHARLIHKNLWLKVSHKKSGARRVFATPSIYPAITGASRMSRKRSFISSSSSLISYNAFTSFLNAVIVPLVPASRLIISPPCFFVSQKDKSILSLHNFARAIPHECTHLGSLATFPAKSGRSTIVSLKSPL
jgi:hypothetical protein